MRDENQTDRPNPLSEPRVQAHCMNGHPHNWWGGPFMVKPNSGAARVWGSPLTCGKCGAPVGHWG
jgi:hypothetical protein